MIPELEQISKTISLVNTVSDIQKILIKNCPNKLIVMNYTNQYFLKAQLHATPQNNQQGIFKNFYIYIHISNLSNQYSTLKKQNHHYEPCLRNSNPITCQNYQGFLIKKQKQIVKTSELFLQKNSYDIKIINLIQALKYSNNYQIDFQQMSILIKSRDDLWAIPVENIPYDIHKPWHEPMTAVNTLDLLRTQQYLREVNLELNQLKSQKEIKQQSNQQNKIQQQKVVSSHEQGPLQNKSSLKQQKKRQQLTNSLQKNTNALNSIIQQMLKIKKQVQVQGQKIQIQQNKFDKILHDLNDLKKQNQHKIKLHRLHQQKQPVPDVVRQKLSIDLHSSYLQKFEIKGTLIKYIGQDKQATQLLSSKIFGISQANKKLKTTLKIIYTKGKCIKFGIIDNKYVNQRSAWNYPNIIFLHAWGHTMVGGHQRNHDLCDYGTDDIVELDVDFQKGQIQWKINNKSMVILNSEAVKKLLKTDVEWVPFIAMYNNLDCVQWKVYKNQ